MKFTVNTDILSKENLTLGEFLVMLMGYHEINYEYCVKKLVEAGLVEPNLFDKISVVLSNNSKDMIARILMESEDKAIQSKLNFRELAEKLQEIYPSGNKPGTTYDWRGTAEEIAQKLRVLVVKYNFTFTEEEAIRATKEYVDSFKDTKFMNLLKYFLLKTKYSEDKNPEEKGHMEIDSMFMTIVENNREHDLQN